MTEWHVISCEYPPQIGGVSSFAATVALGLGRAGHDVHVWCPSADGIRPQGGGVKVHSEMGRFRPADLRRVGRLLDAFPAPRRLLVQWVPHGYGYRSMNLPFCLWVHRRARAGDVVHLMVHEPFLAFAGRWKQRAAAAVHRLMTVVLLRAASRVSVSTPAWRQALEPFAPARDLAFDWLPIPSAIEPVDDPAGVAALRSAICGDRAPLIGHFGLFSRLTADPVKAAVQRLLDRIPDGVALLLGEGSERLRAEILLERRDLEQRVYASGMLPNDDLSRHLQACDLLLQPYPEGITSRRTSTMAPMAHGLPVVTTVGTATERFWRERSAVSLVAAGDLEAMVSEAERLLRDDEARTQLGARARAMYGECFSARHSVNALLAT